MSRCASTLSLLLFSLFITFVSSQNSLPSLIPTVNQINPIKVSLSWQPVDFAKHYLVKVDGVEYSLVSNTFTTVSFEYGVTSLNIQIIANRCSFQAGTFVYDCEGAIKTVAIKQLPTTFDITYFDVRESVFTLLFSAFAPVTGSANDMYDIESFSPVTNAWEYEATLLIESQNFYSINLERRFPNLPIIYRVRNDALSSRSIVIPPRVDFTVDENINFNAVIFNSYSTSFIESRNTSLPAPPGLSVSSVIGDYNHTTYAKFDMSTYVPLCSLLGSYLSFTNASVIEDINSGEFRTSLQSNNDPNFYYSSEQFPKMLSTYSTTAPTNINLGYFYPDAPLSDVYSGWKDGNNDGFKISLYQAWDPSDQLLFNDLLLNVVNEKSYSLTDSSILNFQIIPTNETTAAVLVPFFLVPAEASISSFFGAVGGTVEFTGSVTPQVVLVFNGVAFYHAYLPSQIFELKFDSEVVIPPYLFGFEQNLTLGLNEFQVFLDGANFTSSPLSLQISGRIAKLSDSDICERRIVVPSPSVTPTVTPTPLIRTPGPITPTSPPNPPSATASISITPFPTPYLYIPTGIPSPFPTSNPSPIAPPSPSPSPISAFFPPPPPGSSPSPQITSVCLNCIPIPTSLPVPSSGPGVVVFPVETIGGGIIANVSIPINSLPPGGNVLVRPALESNPDLISSSFDITIVDEFGNAVPLSADAEICLAVTDESQKSKSCLSYLDESVSPPEWKCQDKCLKQKGNSFCGKTPHFTSFAILLTGDTSECGDIHERYIFDSSWKDGLLIGITAGVIICSLCLIAIIILIIPCSDRIVLGSEGNRVKKLRLKSSTIGMSNQVGLTDSGEEVEEIV